MSKVATEKATVANAEEILCLQKLSYKSKAELFGDFNIPPLLQTIDEIKEEFERLTFLKTVCEEMIIGSVRTYFENDTCFIGKLIVHPGYQNRGIGSELLNSAENLFPNAKRYELFTSDKSLRNLYLYEKHGYREFSREKLSEKLTIIFLEKFSD